MQANCLRYARWQVAVVCGCGHVIQWMLWYRADEDVIALAREHPCPWCLSLSVRPDREAEIAAQDHIHTEFLGGPAVIYKTGMKEDEYDMFASLEEEFDGTEESALGNLGLDAGYGAGEATHTYDPDRDEGPRPA